MRRGFASCGIAGPGPRRCRLPTSSGAASWNRVTGCAAFSSMASPNSRYRGRTAMRRCFPVRNARCAPHLSSCLRTPRKKRFRAALSAPQTGQRRCSPPPSRWLSPIYPPSIVLDCIARVQGGFYKSLASERVHQQGHGEYSDDESLAPIMHVLLSSTLAPTRRWRSPCSASTWRPRVDMFARVARIQYRRPDKQVILKPKYLVHSFLCANFQKTLPKPNNL